MSPTPLHPNLARLAAQYDEITERYGRRILSAAEARREVSTLVARDDEGTLWSINPDNGEWLRRTRTGELVPGTPPTYGLATATPYDISSGGGGFNPGDRVEHYAVEDELLYGPSKFTGSTRNVHRPNIPASTSWRDWLLDLINSSSLGKIVASVAVVAVIATGGFVWWHNDHSNASVATTTTTTTIQK
jgi:hypothetical protein